MNLRGENFFDRIYRINRIKVLEGRVSCESGRKHGFELVRAEVLDRIDKIDRICGMRETVGRVWGRAGCGGWAPDGYE